MNKSITKEDLDVNTSDKYLREDKNMYIIEEDIINSELMETTSEEIIYKCFSCRMQVDIIDGEKGYCEQCESIVFIEKL